MRVLDKEKITYEPFSYSSELTEGVKIAEVLGEDPLAFLKPLLPNRAIGNTLCL